MAVAISRRIGLEFPNFADEPVAPLRHCLYVARPVLSFVQSPAHQINDLAQVVLLDHGIAPYGSHQRVFFQQPAAILHERQQRVESPRRKFDARRAISQKALAGV
jgi:hypothetical protein